MSEDVQAKFEFVATFRQYKEGEDDGWHFLFMPEGLAEEIRAIFKSREEGWGRMKVTAIIGGSEWRTSIWFDTKHNTYLLPVKAAIRKKEKLEMTIGGEVMTTILI